MGKFVAENAGEKTCNVRFAVRRVQFGSELYESEFGILEVTCSRRELKKIFLRGAKDVFAEQT